jgi:HEAT repeat protein
LQARAKKNAPGAHDAASTGGYYRAVRGGHHGASSTLDPGRRSHHLFLPGRPALRQPALRHPRFRRRHVAHCAPPSMTGLLISSDVPSLAAIWAVAAAFALAAALLALSLALRLLESVSRRRRTRAQEHWERAAQAALRNEFVEFPRVPTGERQIFLQVWCGLHESVHGDGRESLNTLLRMTGLQEDCRRWLNGVSARRMVLALRTLGHLADPQDWARVRAHLDDPRGFISLSAARALMRIDRKQAMPLVLQRSSERYDWPMGAVYAMLEEVSPRHAADSVRQWITDLPADKLARALALAPSAYQPLVSHAIRDLLRNATDPEVLAACLRLVDDPAVLPRVRELAGHTAFQVRVQAANALERLAQPQDLSLLIWLLGDNNWWVRYRAARALLHLPGTAVQTMREMALAYPEPQVRNILQFVLAEADAQ